MFKTLQEAIDYRIAADMLLTPIERDALSDARTDYFGSPFAYLEWCNR